MSIGLAFYLHERRNSSSQEIRKLSRLAVLLAWLCEQGGSFVLATRCDENHKTLSHVLFQQKSEEVEDGAIRLQSKLLVENHPVERLHIGQLLNKGKLIKGRIERLVTVAEGKGGKEGVTLTVHEEDPKEEEVGGCVTVTALPLLRNCYCVTVTVLLRYRYCVTVTELP